MMGEIGHHTYEFTAILRKVKYDAEKLIEINRRDK